MQLTQRVQLANTLLWSQFAYVAHLMHMQPRQAEDNDQHPAAPRPSSGKESAVGKQKHKRTPTDIGLALITPIVGQEFLDRYNLRDPLNRGLKYGVKQVFSAAGAANRQFKRVSGLAERADATEEERRRLLRPDARRRAEDDRRDRHANSPKR